MKKDQVRIGNLYTAKVSGGIAKVKITDESWLGDKHAGWKGVNTQTGRAVTIKSAQRLRAAVGGKAADGFPNPTPDVGPRGEGTPEVVAVAGLPKPPATGAKGDKAPKATGGQEAEKVKPAKAPKAAKPKAPKKTGGSMSGLDAAARVLAESKKPMTCKEIVAEAFTKKYWRSEGATPEATIYAAIIREISAKGGDARFRKVERGTFTAAKGA
jgi:hypothetical protein